MVLGLSTLLVGGVLGPGAGESTAAPPEYVPGAASTNAAEESSSGQVPSETSSPSPDEVPPPQVVLPAPAPLMPFPDCLPTVGTRTVDVVSFNIHFGRHDGRSTLEPIAAALRTWDADVVLLQEVDRFRRRSGLRDQPAWLAAQLGMSHVYGANVLRRPEGAGRPRSEYGLAILSRFPIVDSVNTRLPNRPGLEQRGLLRARVDINGWLLDVYNTHWQHTSGSMRAAQAAAVRRVVAGGSYPVVLGGDFNAKPGSAPVRTMTSLLTDSWAAGVGPGFTAPASRPGKRIDYLMHSAPLVAESAAVLDSGASDHRAVQVTYSYSALQACPEDPLSEGAGVGGAAPGGSVPDL